LMWTGDENVVKQKRHESGDHARSTRHHRPCMRTQALHASSPPLRSWKRRYAHGRFHATTPRTTCRRRCVMSPVPVVSTPVPAVRSPQRQMPVPRTRRLSRFLCAERPSRRTVQDGAGAADEPENGFRPASEHADRAGPSGVASPLVP